jgi:hypothetical protein
MTAIDLAEKKSRKRAMSFYLFSALSLALLWLSMVRPDSDCLRGMWLGLTFTAALNLLPILRWLRPRSAVWRLLDDDGVREHRRMACTAGFWAGAAAAFAVAIATEFIATITPFDAVRVVATASIAAALTSFATLELRAQRG